MAANISSLLSTYLMLNPLLDHFNPLFIEAVYEVSKKIQDIILYNNIYIYIYLYIN